VIRARQSILIGIFLSWVSAPSLAFEACAIEKLSVPSLHKQISEFVLLSVPAKYLDVAQAIELQVPEREPKLIPYARWDPNTGKRIVVISQEFAQVLCRVAIATALWIDDVGIEQFKRTATETAGCIAKKSPFRDCLVSHAKALETVLKPEMAKMPKKTQDIYEYLFRSALRQIALHEYAHHLHDDFKRGGTIRRKDAEFEADLFAVSIASVDVEPPSAQYYFFKPLAVSRRQRSWARTITIVPPAAQRTWSI
jgi:hypothetical protein